MPSFSAAARSRLLARGAVVFPVAAAAVALPGVANAGLKTAEQKVWYDCSWVTYSVPTEATTVVAGFRVNWCASGAVQQMVNDAAAAGVTLRGSGWRDTNRQIELRKAHCGGDDHHSVWVKPSRECSPATAIPGRSQHERGLAIDIAKNGRSINRSSAEFRWLKANAANYGFYNLPSEPWHWSTTGR